MSQTSRSLLQVGRQAEWRHINDLEDRQRRERSAQMTVEQRVLEAMELSRIAAEIRQAAAADDADGDHP